MAIWRKAISIRVSRTTKEKHLFNCRKEELLSTDEFCNDRSPKCDENNKNSLCGGVVLENSDLESCEYFSNEEQELSLRMKCAVFGREMCANCVSELYTTKKKQT